MGAGNEQLKSELALEEIKRQRAQKDVVDVEEQRVKIVIFSVAGRRYAFYGANIKEILHAGEISWMPCLPEYLPGLINIRGEICRPADSFRKMAGSLPDLLIKISIRPEMVASAAEQQTALAGDLRQVVRKFRLAE